MAGYGNADDHVEAQLLHVEDSLALNRLLADPVDNSTGVCQECGETIPEKRCAVIPGCRYCLPCQEVTEKVKRGIAQYQLRNTYMP